MNWDKYIYTYYNPKMAISESVAENYSMSPNKPKFFIEYLNDKKYIQNFKIIDDFKPFDKDDFLIAHTENYVNAFFNGEKPLCESNNLKWTREFAETVRYTNASLFYAIENSIKNPNQVSFSNTSGFHHANPYSGSAFCTFSGQVIASLKLYRQYGLRGAWIDADAHFGNSIQESYDFAKDLSEAIPIGCNINPLYSHKSYLNDLKNRLDILEEKVLKNEIDYVVHCKGADSHYLDDLKGQLSTKEWLEASKMVYDFVKNVSIKRGKHLPLTISLFGGYRRKAYNKVLELHYRDLGVCREILIKN